MDRRSVLALSGTALAGLAGCSGVLGSDASATTTDDPTITAPGAGSTTPGGGTSTGQPTTSDPQDAPAGLANPSFELGWSGWSIGRHLPEDPNREGEQDVAHEVGVTTWRASDGLASCRLVVDGSQDDGTLWVQQPVDLRGYRSISVDYRVSDSFNHIRNAAVYAGPVPEEPLTEPDFDTSQSLEGHPSKGWRTFSYPVEHDGPGLVAVGFSVVWETRADAHLDDVVLSESPPPEPTTSTTPPDRSDGDDGGIVSPSTTSDGAGNGSAG
ncbi:MAG: hypothetical protein ABEJ42_05035 [Halobacteriaceae archaeon]